MKWEYWMELYLDRHCTARGLSSRTIDAYAMTLEGFRGYVEFRIGDREPDELKSRDLIEYLEYLRRERRNGHSAVNRQHTVLKNFYRAVVAMGQLEPQDNPLAGVPNLKKPPRALPEVLGREEVRRLLAAPRTDTVLGLRDRAMMVLLYGTGIRASECAGLREEDVDLDEKTIRVLGKGGDQRAVPLNEEVVRALGQYRAARGALKAKEHFFRSRRGRGMSRNAVYERVRTTGRKAQIQKRVSPHRLRHTFATDLLRAGVNVVTIQHLLGHRQITSTQVYLHATVEDLRYATSKHPVDELVARIEDILPHVKVPFQYARGERSAFG